MPVKELFFQSEESKLSSFVGKYPQLTCMSYILALVSTALTGVMPGAQWLLWQVFSEK